MKDYDHSMGTWM